MALLVGFAFLAGIVTVLSPCILPVLPVVLSGGIGGGRARPWGVITGFTVTFTVFTLALSTLVQALGFDPEFLRITSAVLIAAFGLVLVVPVLKDRFLAWTSALVSRTARPAVPGKGRGGFWGGLVLGFGLGLVWTPCVGPIMASVITLALTQSVDAGSVLITLAYTLGTAIPLFLVMVGGRTLVNRVPWFTRHAPAVQRGFGILMIATAAALFTGADRSFSAWLLGTFPGYGAGLTALEDQEAVRRELERLRPRDEAPAETAPDPLTLGDGAWIGSEPLTLAGLGGKVVLLDFWTYSCVNCVRTLPYLRDWQAKYASRGLVIVGVHTPEFAFERSEANVRRAVKELGVTWPVVQDNRFGIWTALENQYWPAHYLYDRTGALVETHFGEGGYAETEAAIARALGVPVASGPEPEALDVTGAPRTPETYLGYGRGARFASPEEVAPDKEAVYSLPPRLDPDQWAFSGPWTIGSEDSLGRAGSALTLRFRGARVYLVLGPAGAQPTRVRVSVDGLPQTSLPVDAEKMYTILDQAGRTGGLVTLEFDGPVRVYAFTFG